MAKLKLHTTKGHANGATVELDGQEIQDALRGIDLRFHVNEANTATLDLFLREGADVEGDVDVHLPEATQALLKRLGWTPPA